LNASPSSRLQRSGKASVFRSVRRFRWTKAEDALLGNLTDRQVTEKLNRLADAGNGLEPFD